MNRLLLLAWPGATASAVSRLLDAHRLPHLLQLVERGIIADLRPDCAGSHAMTWATVATGCRADVHGVLGDIRPRDNDCGVRWARTEDWHAPALWHLIDSAGSAACVVNWPATHPAHKLEHGTWISPAFVHAPIDDPRAWLKPSDAVWPASLRQELAELRLHPSELSLSEARSLVPDAATIDQHLDPRLTRILVSLAANATTHAIATHLAQARTPTMLAVHFDLLLAANESAQGAVTNHAYAQTPDAVMEFYDQMLGRYVQLLGEDISVLIVSAGWREKSGILVAAGPSVRGDVRTRVCTTLDVLPIALGLMGLKTPPHLPGSAPLDIWNTGIPEPDELPSCKWKCQPQAEQGPIDHLIAAGYKSAKLHPQHEWAVRQRAIDLAQESHVHLSGGDPRGAVALARQAVQVQPSAPLIEILARVSFVAGDFATAESAADRLLSVDAQSPAGHLIKAFLNHRAGSAIDLALPANRPLEKFYLGILALLRNETTTATQLINQAANAFPDDAGVHHALGLALLQSGDDAQAIIALGRAAAFSARPAIPLLHLAQILLRSGDQPRAEQALRRAIQMDPNCTAAQNALKNIVRKQQLQAARSAASQ